MKAILKHFDPVLVRLARYALPYKFRFVWAAFWMIGVASTTALTSKLLGLLTDEGFYKQDASMIVAAPLALVAITLMYAIATVMSSYILTQISQTILIEIRTKLFYNVLHWPQEEYQKHTTGEVCSKFVNEANIALGGAVQAAMVLLRDSMQVVALFGLLLWQNWQLTLVSCVVGPLAGFILRRIRQRTRKIVKQSQEAIADTLSRVQESYEAQRLVKVSGTYDFEENRFAKINETIRKTGLKRLKFQSLGTPVTQVVTMMGVAVVVVFALLQARQGNLSVGDFITFLSAMLFLMQPLQNLASLNATFTSISVAAKSIFDMMDAPLQKDAGKHQLGDVKGAIEFRDVCVKYPGAGDLALKSLNLKIAPGEHVAFVGHSGSGKTTTVNLIPRFIDPSSGSITVDGIDVRNCTLESLRRNIAVVAQDVVLFDATIRENVAYGVENASQEALEMACEAAALSGLLKQLPKGLDTPVGEAGNLLSGGQKQRISIARAFLKDAPILILDEATSALDSQSEQVIKESLERLMRGRTSLCVAHRFSTIDQVDRVIVLDKGSIVQEGKHKQLLACKGIYSEMYALQVCKK